MRVRTSPPDYRSSSTNFSLERPNNFEELQAIDDDDNDDCTIPDISTTESSGAAHDCECQVKDAAADESIPDLNSPVVAPTSCFRFRLPLPVEKEHGSVPPMRHSDLKTSSSSRRQPIDCLEAVSDDTSQLNPDEIVEHL